MPVKGHQETRVYKSCFVPSGSGHKLIYIHVGTIDEQFIDKLTEWVNIPGEGRLTLIKKFIIDPTGGV